MVASPAKAARRSVSPARVAQDRQARCVALIGSSGGSTMRTSVQELRALRAQLEQLEAVQLTALCFVDASCPLDHSADDTPALLWTLDAQGEPTCTTRGTLAAVNRAAAAEDVVLAHHVRASKLDAVVLVSAHFGATGVNEQTLAAAVATRTPLLGTGGTSLGRAVEAGGQVLQLSGSVSTTAESRAIAAAAALARHWRVAYEPKLPASECALLPVLDEAFPCLLSFSVLRAAAAAAATFGRGGGWSGASGGARGGARGAPGGRGEASATRSAVGLTALADRAADALALAARVATPTALGALAAHRAAQLGTSGVTAGMLAGGLTAVAPTLADPLGGDGGLDGVARLRADGGVGAADGGVSAAALVAGLAAGLAARRALCATHANGLPATASTLLTVGAAGAAGGTVGVALAPLSTAATALVRALLVALAQPHASLLARSLAGGVIGALTKWGSVHGYYHCVMLPLIMVEMEGGSLSLLGAFDMCCLCCVCAGVCAAVAIASGAQHEAQASRRAVAINLLLGDYVEACYPYMARSQLVNAAAYLGAALAGATLLGASTAPGLPSSSAYLPLPIAVGLSERPACVAAAAALGFGVAFVGSLLANAVANTPRPEAQSSGTRAATAARPRRRPISFKGQKYVPVPRE